MVASKPGREVIWRSGDLKTVVEYDHEKDVCYVVGEMARAIFPSIKEFWITANPQLLEEHIRRGVADVLGVHLGELAGELRRIKGQWETVDRSPGTPHRPSGNY